MEQASQYAALISKAADSLKALSAMSSASTTM